MDDQFFGPMGIILLVIVSVNFFNDLRLFVQGKGARWEPRKKFFGPPYQRGFFVRSIIDKPSKSERNRMKHDFMVSFTMFAVGSLLAALLFWVGR